MINQGIAFGLWQGVPLWVLVVVWIVVLFYAFLPAQAGNMRELWGRIGIGMIALGGGLNLMSRVRHGGVIDDLTFFGLVYNNGADYLIFFGLVIYGYTYFVRRQ